MSPHEQGQAAHAQGIARDVNPYTDSPEDHDAWAAGWDDAAALAAPDAEGADAETNTAPVEGMPQGGAPPAEEETAAAATDPVEVLDAMGEAGYDRILELLAEPPLGDDDLPLPGFPPSGEVPEDLGEWLEAFKQPLVGMAVGTVVSGARHYMGGPNTSRGRLKELYRGMPPLAMAAAMSANAEKLSKFADARVAEAGIITSLQARVTQKAVGFLLSALLI